MVNYERPGQEKKVEKGPENQEAKKETGIESPEDIQARIEANNQRIDGLRKTESTTSEQLKKDEAELGMKPETDVPSAENSEEEIAALQKENAELEKQKQVAEALQDPEERKKFEETVNQMGSLSPEALEHAKETGEIHSSQEAAPEEKGVNFEMKFSMSNEAIKNIAGMYTEGYKTVGEIIKKIPPEVLLALLA